MSTIGSMNGPWATMLRFMLASYPIIIGWAVWMTANQFKDNAFRGEGERFTRQDAESQTKIITQTMSQRLVALETRMTQMVPASELVTHPQLLDHERLDGHAVLNQRVSHLEKIVEGTAEVEAEETEILRKMQQEMKAYMDWRMRNE